MAYFLYLIIFFQLATLQHLRFSFQIGSTHIFWLNFAEIEAKSTTYDIFCFLKQIIYSYNSKTF